MPRKKTTTTDTTTTELITTTSTSTTVPVCVMPESVPVPEPVVDFPQPVPSPDCGSGAYQLDMSDYKALGKNLVIISVGYVVTYFSLHVMTVDVTATTMAIAPIVAGAIDAALRFFKNNKKK